MHSTSNSLKLAVEHWKNLDRGTETGICCDCGYVNLEDNFMKFTQQVLQGVNCQGQKVFSPGGTHGGDFKLCKQNWTFPQPDKGPKKQNKG